MTNAVDAAYVVIPAHQEAALIARQLTAVRAAVHHAANVWPRVRLSVTVVLDACDDGTADVVARFPEVTVVETRLRCVGAARQRGVERARRGGPARAERAWVASTDADSQVPLQWLSAQLEYAARGADMVLGTVVPDREQVAGPARERWFGRHRLEDGHPHVHGANLGFRLSAYDLVGGFRALAVGEDADLAARFGEHGLPTVRTSRQPVLTSSRLVSRAPAGFAAYLTAL